MNVTNVKQTAGSWEQLQTVDGMLLHGCSQECASLPFVLRTNWGGKHCPGWPNPRGKGDFSSVKSSQTLSASDFDTCENASQSGLNP